MSSRLRGTGKVSIAAVALTALSALLLNNIRRSGPPTVDAAELSGWTLVSGKSGEPGIVALQPPSHFSGALFQDLRVRTGRELIAPPRSVMPLVLQSEYEDSLQGVLSVDDMLRIARESGIETARFEPICMGERTRSGQAAPEELFFVVFDSPAFADFRQRILPLHTEHGGISIYDPGALRPVLTIAGTDRESANEWPTAIAQGDCLFAVESKN